jgi:SNF2 family DNA or RNA helicase
MIADVHSDAGVEPQYEVFFSATETKTYPEHALLPIGADSATNDPVELLRRWELGDAESFKSFLTLAKLTKPVANNLYSFLASRTELLPYQFKPVLKLIESPYSRILIADEVGLGKTIEAGIILTELNARSPLRRVLVVCPSSLQRKWRLELEERFAWELEILDGERFRESIEDSSRDPDAPLRAIGSMHLLRRQENLDLMVERRPRFDAVVVDEAHHMRNSGTATNHLGEVLADSTDTLIFLTATPLNLGEHDFFELIRLLVPEEFSDFDTFASLLAPNDHLNRTIRILREKWPPDFERALSALRKVERTPQGMRLTKRPDYREAVRRLEQAKQEGDGHRAESVYIQRLLTDLNTLSHVFTRTRKREVSTLFPVRRAHKVAVRFTEAEMAFYEEISRWVIETYTDVPTGFILTVFQAQAGSCLPAFGRKLDEILNLSAIRFTGDEIWEAVDVDEGGEEQFRVELGARHLETIERLAKAWREVGEVDTKYERFESALLELLAQGERKVLVFSFFIRTIDYLEERISKLAVGGEPVEVLKLYGPTSPEERHKVINRFREGTGPQIMLSSEVGSEGLDFQFCSTMFNYDLPWNPMRVEQRIGRLDRYGQEAEVVQIHNMVVEDTIEDRIFYRLYERIRIFEGAVGDLEAILGSELRDLQREIFRMTLTPEEQRVRSDLIAEAIERRQQDHDRFEEDSKKFVGADEVFEQRFNDIRDGERYITADEVQTFVERFLKDRFPKMRLRVLGKEVFELEGDDEPFVRLLIDSYYAGPNQSKLDFGLIHRIRSSEPFMLTFDARRAAQDRTLEFVSIHHLLVRAIVRSLSEQGDVLPTAALQIPECGSKPHFFFIFELDIRAMRREIEFIASVVDPDGQVDAGLSEDFMRLARQAEAVSLDGTGLLTDDRLDQAVTAARAWAADRRNEREAEIRRLHDDVLDTKLESLRHGHERRKLWVTHQLAEARDERIERMRRGQLANLDEEYERKRRQLEERRGVDLGYELVAAGVAL